MTSEQGQPEITSDEVLSMSHYRQRASGVGKRCPYCAHRMRFGGPNPPTRDHVHPKSLGGSDDPSNILIVCKSCNNDKADMTLGQFLGMLMATDDCRAAIVRVLVEDAADFDPTLGAQLYADAGIRFGKVKRKRKKPTRVAVRWQSWQAPPAPQPKPTPTHTVLRVSEDELIRQRVAVAVMDKLKIERSHWGLSLQSSALTVLMGGIYEQFPVGTSATDLEKRIQVQKDRRAREAIDCRMSRFAAQPEVAREQANAG